MRALRVLIVTSGFPPQARWGTDLHGHQLALALRERGHTVEALHPLLDGAQPRGTLLEREHDRFRVWMVHNAPDPRKALADSYASPALERTFGELVARTRPDIVHFVHLMWSLSVELPRIAREHGARCVITLTDLGLLCHRGTMFDFRGRDCGGPLGAAQCARCIREPAPWESAAPARYAKRAVVRALALLGGAGRVVTTRDVERRAATVARALRHVAVLVAPTRAIAEVFVRGGVARERIEHVPYGVDRAALAGARSEPAGTLVRIGYLGQFAPHKGVHVLMDAVRTMSHRLPESVEPWEVRCFGGVVHPRHRRYAAALAAKGLAPRVRIESRFDADEIGPVLADLHAVVVPSLWIENAPFAALQARAAGIPVVASDEPGVREIIAPGSEGLLFPPGDAHALADVLRSVILRRVQRSPSAPPPPSLDEHVRAIEGVYERALAAQEPPA